MSYKYKWQTMQSGVIPAIEKLINRRGQVTGYPLQGLPPGYLKMNGIQAAFWSGYMDDIRVAVGITGLGEVILQRVDNGVLKSYAYPLGISGVEYFMGNQFKRLPGHHAPVIAPAPYPMLFGYIPWPDSTIIVPCAGQYPGV